MMLQNIAFSQTTGTFEKELIIDGKPGMVAFYVPEEYDTQTEWPLVIAMSPGSGPGLAIRDMLMPIAMERDFILACPDFIVGDGSECLAVLDMVKSDYNIDTNNVVTSGYSAGGRTTFTAAADNPDEFLGSVGIAVAAYTINYSEVRGRAFGLICGTADQLYTYNKNMAAGIENNGGACLFIEKEGVAHTGPYFGSPEFYDDWMECYDFVQNYTPPETVELVAPADNSQKVEMPVTFEWKPADDATSYEFQLNYYANVVLTTETQNTTISIDTLQPNTTYKWRVKAVSSSNYDWSQWWTFTTAKIAPNESPELLQPENKTYNVDSETIFRWRGVEYADRYEFRASTDDFETIEVEERVNSPGFVINLYGIEIEDNMTYKWRVRGGNEVGYGPWSDPRVFYTFDPSGIGENGTNDYITKVFPNPAVNKINIGFSLPGSALVGIRLFSAEGIQMISCEQRLPAGSGLIALDISDMPNGVYAYRINHNEHIKTGTILISR